MTIHRSTCYIWPRQWYTTATVKASLSTARKMLKRSAVSCSRSRATTAPIYMSVMMYDQYRRNGMGLISEMYVQKECEYDVLPWIITSENAYQVNNLSLAENLIQMGVFAYRFLCCCNLFSNMTWRARRQLYNIPVSVLQHSKDINAWICYEL